MRHYIPDMLGKLLLVDDNPLFLMALESYFALKWNVVSASDGQEALDQLKSITPDAIICDFQMPRLNGLELAHAVRSTSRLRAIPFFLITASQPTEKDLLRSGVTKLVQKPFEISELSYDIRKAVDLSRAADDLSAKGREYKV